MCHYISDSNLDDNNYKVCIISVSFDYCLYNLLVVLVINCLPFLVSPRFSMFLPVLPRIVFIIITQSLLFNCETETISDLFACPDPPSITYLETNSSVTKYIDYRSNCARQWVLKREGYNYTGSNLEVVKEAILILSHLDLDSSAGDYLLVSSGIPDETYKPKILVITSKINDESKTIAVSSPITWIGLVNNAAYKPAISLTFTWVAPELKIKEEIFPTELRSASVDLCFEEIDCPIVSENQQFIKSGLTEMVNQFIYDENSTHFQQIDEQQIKIIRNESRINDEQVSVNKYCRVQLAVTSQVDINWAHPGLTKEILTTIWLSTNTSAQIISIPGDRLSFKACQDESFDPFITLQSAGIFIAGLGASIGLWRWHHSHVLSAKKAIKPKVDSVLASTETKHNPIYESDGEDEDYVLGEREHYN